MLLYSWQVKKTYDNLRVHVGGESIGWTHEAALILLRWLCISANFLLLSQLFRSVPAYFWVPEQSGGRAAADGCCHAAGSHQALHRAWPAAGVAAPVCFPWRGGGVDLCPLEACRSACEFWAPPSAVCHLDFSLYYYIIKVIVKMWFDLEECQVSSAGGGCCLAGWWHSVTPKALSQMLPHCY